MLDKEKKTSKISSIHKIIIVILVFFIFIVGLFFTFNFIRMGIRESKQTGNNKIVQSDYTDKVRIHFLSVGDADSMLIQMGNNEEVILMDAGRNYLGADIITYLKNLGIDKIDTYIITHPHPDHIGDFNQIMNMFEVSQIYTMEWKNPTENYGEDYENMIESAKEHHVPLVFSKQGDKLFDENGILLETISEPIYYMDDLNDGSIVTRLTYGTNSILFGADANNIVEEKLLEKYKGEELQSDVLKIGHHGWTNATSEEWLRAVNPKWSIISCSNKFLKNEMFLQTSKKLMENNSEVIALGETGTTLLVLDGKDYEFYQDPFENSLGSAGWGTKNILSGINENKLAYEIPIQVVSDAPKAFTLKNGEKIQIKMIGSWDTPEISSNEESVVKVKEDGIIEAMKTGETSISVSDGEWTLSYEVIVE